MRIGPPGQRKLSIRCPMHLPAGQPAIYSKAIKTAVSGVDSIQPRLPRLPCCAAAPVPPRSHTPHSPASPRAHIDDPCRALLAPRAHGRARSLTCRMDVVSIHRLVPRSRSAATHTIGRKFFLAPPPDATSPPRPRTRVTARTHRRSSSPVARSPRPRPQSPSPLVPIPAPSPHPPPRICVPRLPASASPFPYTAATPRSPTLPHCNLHVPHRPRPHGRVSAPTIVLPRPRAQRRYHDCSSREITRIQTATNVSARVFVAGLRAGMVHQDKRSTPYGKRKDVTF